MGIAPSVLELNIASWLCHLLTDIGSVSHDDMKDDYPLIMPLKARPEGLKNLDSQFSELRLVGVNRNRMVSITRPELAAYRPSTGATIICGRARISLRDQGRSDDVYPSCVIRSPGSELSVRAEG